MNSITFITMKYDSFNLLIQQMLYIFSVVYKINKSKQNKMNNLPKLAEEELCCYSQQTYYLHDWNDITDTIRDYQIVKPFQNNSKALLISDSLQNKKYQSKIDKLKSFDKIVSYSSLHDLPKSVSNQQTLSKRGQKYIIHNPRREKSQLSQYNIGDLPVVTIKKNNLTSTEVQILRKKAQLNHLHLKKIELQKDRQLWSQLLTSRKQAKQANQCKNINKNLHLRLMRSKAHSVDKLISSKHQKQRQKQNLFKKNQQIYASDQRIQEFMKLIRSQKRNSLPHYDNSQNYCPLK